MLFRSDINGLRAIAVIAVVIYHFNNNWLPGGFAGVDVFFVISGYLMTGIIFSKISNQKFVLLDFYMARANRIIPSLAILCIALLVLGWFYLTPDDYRMLGKHALSSVTFVSNFVYWQEAGYFDTSSHSKWLLHTWSLAVEWQFYILYPLILLFLSKFLSLDRLKFTVLLLLVFSLIYNLYVTELYTSSAFYLLPSRAWELLLGGAAFLFPLTATDRLKRILEIIGLLLIVFTYFILSSQNAWPGYFALLPVVGAYLVILSNTKSSLLTGNFIFQKIGTWSYSIYLWHWPLAVIYFNYLDDQRWIYFGLILSVLIGYLSHKYIESMKFNRQFNNLMAALKTKPIFLLFIVMFLAGVINNQKGFDSRLTSEQRQILNPMEVVESFYSKKTIEIASEECRLYRTEGISFYSGCGKLDEELNDIDLLIIGDSHGGAISPGAFQSLIINKGAGNVLNLRASGCIPLRDIKHRNDTMFSDCDVYNDYLFNELSIKYSGVPILMLVRLNLYLYGFNEKGEIDKPFIRIDGVTGEEFKKALKNKFINNMCALSETHPLYILKPVPEVGIDVPNKMLANHMAGINKQLLVSYQEYDSRNAYTAGIFSELEKTCQVTLLDPLPYLDANNGYAASKNGLPLFLDDNHLNLLGAKVISPVFDTIWK